MEVTLESVEKNKGIYNENIKKIMEQRAELMKQVSELRRKRETLTDEIDIAELDFEESKLVQQINDLTAAFKGNKLTLEQLALQQDRLELKIDQEAYSRGIVTNREAKADLSKEQELTYCENEVKKCEKALKLYTLIGDTENIDKWQKALSDAHKSLKFAKQEIANEQKVSDEKDKGQDEKTQAPYINEYGEIVRPDNSQEETKTEEYQAGYSYEEKDGIYTEEWNQVLKDDYGKEIGNRTITEVEKPGGIRTVKSVGEIENDDGKYSMNEISEGLGEEYSVSKQIKGHNKRTGNNEQFNYSKDELGNEFAYSIINGKMNLRVSKTNRGTTIEIYDEKGNAKDTFEYDKNGKAIEGVQGMDEIKEDYVENFFKKISRNVPEYYAERVDKSIPTKENGDEDILKSGIEATEETTRTSTINEQEQNIRNIQREKTQQQNKENTGIDR